MISFEGRRIVIIGGGTGIGLATTELLARLGGNVFVADLDPDARDRIPAAAGFVRADATDPDNAATALEQAARSMGGIDGMFITVGGSTSTRLADLDLAAWDRQLRFNLDATYICCRAALPLMGRGGALVTTSSGRAIEAVVDQVAYSVAKAGVMAFSRSLAAIAAPVGVRVNSIAPGPTDTARFRRLIGGEGGVEAMRQSVPLGTITTPGDVANLAAFLLSDAASQITGQTIHINGGMLMP